MASIFGIDVPGVVSTTMGAARGSEGDCVLIVVTQGALDADPTKGYAKSETSYPCKGGIADYEESEIDGAKILEGDRKVTLYGGSLGGAVPEPNHKVTVEGATYRIIKTKRTPLGSKYVCQVRR